MTRASPPQEEKKITTSTTTDQATPSIDSSSIEGNSSIMMAVLSTARAFPGNATCAAHDSTVTASTISTATACANPGNTTEVVPTGHVETASAQHFPAHSDSAIKEAETKRSPPQINASSTSSAEAGLKSDSSGPSSLEPPPPFASFAQQEEMCRAERKMPPSALKSDDSTENTVSESDVLDVDRASLPPMEETTPKTENTKKKKKIMVLKPGQSAGRWTQGEHQAFLEGLKVFGREWKKVAERIPTRTSAQIRSHAQKYFSKLDREEEENVICPVSCNPVPPQDSATSPLSSLPPSVQRNVDRILADPMGAQQEVEDTLRALRERYRQLQIQLQDRNRARHGIAGGSVGNIVHDENDSSSQHHYEQQRRLDQRKRAFQDTQQEYNDDDISSSPSSPASWSPSRELGDQELTAVLVLGGTLPRSASNQDMRNNQTAEQANSSSSSSSVGSNQCDDDTSENKRRRMSGDGGHKGDSDDSGQNDGMVL